MDSDELTISLLGPPLIAFRGKAIRIKRRKVRYLCYYLACQENPVSRAKLCDVFWPECDEIEARKNLRETLSNLRSSFSMDNYLIIRGEFISLDAEKIVVDVRDFERVIQAIRKNQGISSGVSFTDAVYLNIRDGIQLWRAPGFLGNATLEGSEVFQKWVTEKNENLEYWRQVMLEWMADHCITLGNLNEALQWLSQALLNDRQNTELNLLTLNCLRDQGVSKEISHFCDTLESVYQENGLSTLPQVLSDAIVRARGTLNNPAQSRPLVWKDTDPYRIHYVDSNQRMDRLKRRLQKGGMVLLRGEEGLGKSRLLKEFYNSLEVIPRLIYHCSKPGEETIPYQALVDGFKKAVSEEEWRTLDSIYAKTLFPLFPFLSKIRSDLKTEDLQVAIRLKRLLPEAFLVLFLQIAQHRRVLFILDDAQWCDNETLQVLAYVHEQGGPEEVGMAVLAAGVEVSNTALGKMYARYSSNYFVDEIDIAPLSQDEISEITYLVFGEKPSRAVRLWLYQECGGNPGLLIDILNSMREADTLRIEDSLNAETYPLNQPLQKNLQRRLNELSQNEQDLLKIAAVVGREFTPDVFELVSGETPEKLEKALRLFTEKRFLQVKQNASACGRYEFIHGVMSRWLLEQLPPGEKRLLHLKTIEALQNISGDTLENSMIIARHFDAIQDLRGAFRYWLHAGDQARKAYLPDSVNLAFGRALELCEILGEGCDSADYYHLVRAWSDFCIDLGDLKTSEMIFSKGMKEGKKRSDQRLIGFVESGEALLESMSGHFEVALKFINQAIDRLSKVDSLENYARAYALRGVIETLQGEFLAAIHDFTHVNDMTIEGEDVALDDLRSFCAPYLICAYCGVGRLQEANEFLSQAMQAAQLSNQPNYFAIIRASAGVVLLAEGNYAGALEAIYTLNLAEQGFGIQWWQDIFKIIEASVYLELGELSLCWKLLEAFQRKNASSEKFTPLIAYALYLQGEIYSRLTEYSLACTYYEKCLEVTKNEFIRLVAEFGLSICQNSTNEDEKKAALAAVFAKAKERNYFLVENIILVRYMIFFGEGKGEELFADEIFQLRQQANSEGLTFLAPTLALISEIIAGHRQRDIFDGEMIRQYLADVEGQGNFWVKVYGLSEILAYSTDKRGLASEKRNYRQLLERLTLTNTGEMLESAVKKFVNEKSKVLKALKMSTLCQRF